MARNTATGKSKTMRKKLRLRIYQSKIKNPKSKIQAGFSLLELMIAMFILIILLSVAVPTYQKMVQTARENVLKENLWQIRRAIDQYSADKGKAPASVDDLVKENYLRETPVDPITERAEWQVVTGEDPNATDGGTGMLNVKSLADGEDSEGKLYSEY